MSDFYKEYQELLHLALDYGIRNTPQGKIPLPGSDANSDDVGSFLAACHEGFTKAQNGNVTKLAELDKSGINPSERKRHEILLKKIADTIAITMLRGQTHVMRRLSLHNDVPTIQPDVILDELNEANLLNNESSQTFALLADLTTFIHIADIMRIDCRKHPYKVSFIELKKGEVNNLLTSQLKGYQPHAGSLQAIDSDQ
jgi:hypothetical protein